MEFYLGILCGLVGVCLLAWAVFRPRRGDVAHCRRCGFSLAGLKEPAVCPECGRSLSLRRAIVVGERPRRKRLIVVFAVLAGLASALLWLDGANRRGFIPFNSYKPAWLLVGEAYLLDVQRANAATEELDAQINSGKLDTSWQDRLVRVALDRHRQTWRAFPDAQWPVLTRAMGRGELSFEQVKRVYDDCGGEIINFGIDFTSGSPVYPGDTLRITGEYGWRAGVLVVATGSDFGFLHVPRGSVRVQTPEGIIESEPEGMRIAVVLTDPKTLGGFFDLMYTIPNDLKPGTYTAELVVDLDADEHSTIVNWVGVSKEDLPKYDESLKKQLTTTFEIRVVEEGSLDPPTVDPASLADDPSTLLQFQVDNVWGPNETKGVPRVQYTFGTTEAMDPAVGVSGVVVFEQDGVEIRSSPSYIGPNEPTRSIMPLEGFQAGPVRVFYAYDEQEARLHRHLMDRALGGRVELGVIEVPGIRR